ncbi:amyloid beta precursor protein-binding-like protein [Pitangus sulphuratus]|nr:amyloid beta precursor protein-binding-like protein [Pitangus sulphuratus]
MMSCAELLAVCLLSAERGPAPRRQPLPIFHDIFRRADKNDDGKLSFEEFKNYFADGILSSEELWELFSGIDRRHSDNVDTEKLCDYFSAYLGEYRNVLSALETLNAAVLAAMDKTKLPATAVPSWKQLLDWAGGLAVAQNNQKTMKGSRPSPPFPSFGTSNGRVMSTCFSTELLEF